MKLLVFCARPVNRLARSLPKEKIADPTKPGRNVDMAGLYNFPIGMTAHPKIIVFHLEQFQSENNRI